jgi:filamentous hemagglutinin
VQIAAASLDNRNTIGSTTTLAVQAAGTISSGTLQATGDASLNAATLDNSGTVRAVQGALNVSSSARTGNSGRMEAAQAVNLKLGSLDNSGGVNAGERLRIEAAQGVSNDGTLAANERSEPASRQPRQPGNAGFQRRCGQRDDHRDPGQPGPGQPRKHSR